MLLFFFSFKVKWSRGIFASFILWDGFQHWSIQWIWNITKTSFFRRFLEPGLKDHRMTWVRFNVSSFPFFQWSPPLLLSIKMLPAMLMRQESCTLRVRANSVTQWFERYRDIWVKSSNSGWVSISPLIKKNQFLSYISGQEHCPKLDFEDECKLNDPCAQSPCAVGVTCRPCNGCESYDCSSFDWSTEKRWKLHAIDIHRSPLVV